MFRKLYYYLCCSASSELSVGSLCANRSLSIGEIPQGHRGVRTISPIYPGRLMTANTIR